MSTFFVFMSFCLFQGTLFYNKFRSVVSYKTSEIPIFPQRAVSAADKLTAYDSIDSDVLQSYLEFSLASLIYYAMKEGACSEQSSRMTAMDSSSKNAGTFSHKSSFKTLNYFRTKPKSLIITQNLWSKRATGFSKCH